MVSRREPLKHSNVEIAVELQIRWHTIRIRKEYLQLSTIAFIFCSSSCLFIVGMEEAGADPA